MNDKEKIRAEIFWRYDKLKLCNSSEAKSRREAYKELLQFIYSLPEETSEDLEEAAAQYAKYTAAPPSDVAYHFVAGVSWQRNRVWHDIDEKPNMRKFVVFSDGKKSMTPPLRNMFDDYPMLIDAANRKYGGGYKVWAYAEDLLPNKEGEK